MKPGRLIATLMTSGAAAALSLILLRRRLEGCGTNAGLRHSGSSCTAESGMRAVRRGCSRPAGEQQRWPAAYASSTTPKHSAAT